jgi:hypothetical protein
MLSVGLVSTWSYHLYDKTVYSHQKHEVFVKDSIAVAEGVADSLQRIYSGMMKELGARLDSSRDSQGILQTELQAKLSEIYKLRSEINQILKKNDIRKADVDLARQKAIELQLLVNDLQSRNSSIEEEKLQINAMLDKVNVQVKDLETSNHQLDQENKAMAAKLSAAGTFIATDIRFSPVMVKNDKEVETSNVSKVSKFVISFSVINNVQDYDKADVFVIITQPDGSLLTTDVWESSAMMDTNNEGQKRYTRKIRFEYRKAETKELFFSINAEQYQKGTYILQLYHNGSVIGQARRTLS